MLPDVLQLERTVWKSGGEGAKKSWRPWKSSPLRVQNGAVACVESQMTRNRMPACLPNKGKNSITLAGEDQG